MDQKHRGSRDRLSPQLEDILQQDAGKAVPLVVAVDVAGASRNKPEAGWAFPERTLPSYASKSPTHCTLTSRHGWRLPCQVHTKDILVKKLSRSWMWCQEPGHRGDSDGAQLTSKQASHTLTLLPQSPGLPNPHPPQPHPLTLTSEPFRHMKQGLLLLPMEG